MERPRTAFDTGISGGFVFRQRSGKINWQEIQAVDIEELVKRGDTSMIARVLENLIYADLEKNDLDRFPESFMVKMLKISQLALEYLQNQNNIIEENAKEITQEKCIIEQNAKQLQERLIRNKKNSEGLLREIGHKKKILGTYEHYLIKNPAKANGMAEFPKSQRGVKCETCSKCFINSDYYARHKERRHSLSRTGQAFDVKLMKSNFEEQLKVLQDHQLKEISEFKSSISTQLLEIKRKSAPTPEPKIHHERLESVSIEIEKKRKELLDIKHKKALQDELNRKTLLEIKWLEAETQKLFTTKEKISKKLEMQLKKSSSSFTEPNPHTKYRSDSGEVKLINSVFNDLVIDNPLHITLENIKDEDNSKREASTPYSQRMSPTFKDSLGEKQYILPSENPEPGDIIEAAKVLGIDPVRETQYLYLATQFLKSPIPKAWMASKSGGVIVFKHKETGVVQEIHPGIQYYQQVYDDKKHRKGLTFDKIKSIIKNPGNRYLINSVHEGITSFFLPEENSFQRQKGIIRDKIQSALDRMKNISNQQLNKINEEREKIFNESGGEYRRANEIISSELLRIFTKMRNN